MRAGLLPRLQCPACGGGGSDGWTVDPIEQAGPDIRRGQLTCRGCGSTYPITDEMPHVHLDDESWASKAREAAGWVAYSHEHGFSLTADFALPYLPAEPWSSIAANFDRALTVAALRSGDAVLDLGAGRGWAAKHLALRQMEVVAVDVCPDVDVALGRGRAMMDQAGVFFERVIGDAERLPFAAAVFDHVFVNAALHHTNDLVAVLAEVARVLRPGGQLVAMAEPVRIHGEDEAAVLAAIADDEIRFGITERRPSAVEIVDALEAARLEPRRVWSNQLFTEDGAEYRPPEVEGGRWPTVRPRRPRSTALSLGRFGRRMLADRADGLRAHRRLREAAAPSRDETASRLLWSRTEIGFVAARS